MKSKRIAKLLTIAQLGHPMIRSRAKEIVNIADRAIHKLINDLKFTVKHVDGVGIAAPQVYKSIRVFLIASRPNSRYPRAPKMKPFAVVNPSITSTSAKKIREWEGCLSIPGIRAIVPRHQQITVSYTNVDGKKIKKNFKGFLARIFQHEYDHLEGTVILDRVESTKDVITEKEYQKMIKK